MAHILPQGGIDIITYVKNKNSVDNLTLRCNLPTFRLDALVILKQKIVPAVVAMPHYNLGVWYIEAHAI